jgi:integrase
MFQLPNGCYRSEISVTPKNWKRLSRITRDWRIHYRFYDPSAPEPINQVRQITVKGMNVYKTICQRQESTQELLEITRQMLNEGYNPITKGTIAPTKISSIIHPSTSLIHALPQALSRITVSQKTKVDISHVVTVCIKAAIQLNYDFIEISKVRRSHIRIILEHCGKLQSRFSDNTFNHYRAYLNMLFNELLEVEAVESNPVKDIKKKTVTVMPRPTLSDEQRIKVNDHLQAKHPNFHRFLHIFFHSGARITELMKVRAKDVDLKTQRYTCEILKGKKSRIVQRTIKDIALPLWTEVVQNAKPDDYIFSRGLKPGHVQIQPYQVTKRWYRIIKKGKDENGNPLNIAADFYSLKHLNTSEVVDRLGDEAAAKLNEHTTTGMVVKIYDHKRKDRQHEQLKKLDNTFVK